jgi:DNA polymerase bacteriophage-type
MQHIVFDFETKSEIDLLKVGAWRYSCHPSTDILCASFLADGQLYTWKNPHATDLEIDQEANLNALWVLRSYLELGVLLEAHNALFERVMWENCFIPKHGQFSPGVYLPKKVTWDCTAARAAILTLPRSLDKAAMVLGLKEQKDMAGSAVMRKLCVPVKQGIVAEFNREPAMFEKLYAYCEQDVRTEAALSKVLPPLPPMETEVYQLDQLINTRGVKVDVALIDKCISHLEYYGSRANARLKQVTGGYVTSAKEAAKMKKWLATRGVETEDLDRDAVNTLLARNDLPGDVREFLNLRVMYEALWRVADPRDNRVRDYILYAGAARTGRWAGKLIQPQNFPRPVVDVTEDLIQQVKNAPVGQLDFSDAHPIEVLTSMLRSVFVASDGYEMYGADYSAIEARVLFWLAKEEAGLEVYRGDGKIYEDMAATIFSKPRGEVVKGERQLGKQAVLGCGYQMGVSRFRGTCLSYGMDVSESLAQKAVTAYRAKYPNVPRLWYNCQDAFKSAMANPGITYTVGYAKFISNKFITRIILPSGRHLLYYEPKMTLTPGDEYPKLTYKGIDQKTKQWTDINLYGGKIVENITQAVARDLMAHAMLALEKEGYQVLLTVHDEIIAERPITDSRDVQDYVTLMCQLPTWAEGLPLAAEGWKGTRYGK